MTPGTECQAARRLSGRKAHFGVNSSKAAARGPSRQQLASPQSAPGRAVGRLHVRGGDRLVSFIEPVSGRGRSSSIVASMPSMRSAAATVGVPPGRFPAFRTTLPAAMLHASSPSSAAREAPQRWLQMVPSRSGRCTQVASETAVRFIAATIRAAVRSATARTGSAARWA